MSRICWGWGASTSQEGGEVGECAVGGGGLDALQIQENAFRAVLRFRFHL